MKILQGPECIRERLLHYILRISGIVDDTQAGIIHRLRIFPVQLRKTPGISLFASFYQFVV
jgi:hypothetical protein